MCIRDRRDAVVGVVGVFGGDAVGQPLLLEARALVVDEAEVAVLAVPDRRQPADGVVAVVDAAAVADGEAVEAPARAPGVAQGLVAAAVGDRSEACLLYTSRCV